jgi:OHCU decarboxylase
MGMTLAEFNAAEPEMAREILSACCGSNRWVNAMLAGRPFTTPDGLYQAAESNWWSLDSADWLEAFSKHPKIGERRVLSSWSAEEQSGMKNTAESVTGRLARKNSEYEQKFGWIFLICASGKTADEVLNELERRLLGDPRSELRTAVAEQAKITRLRLAKALAL